MQIINLSSNIDKFSSSKSNPVFDYSHMNFSNFITEKLSKTIKSPQAFYFNKIDQNTIPPFINNHKHPLINALNIAYSNHIPVEISPDDIWLTILSGLSIHLNNNANAKNKFAKDNNLSTSNKKQPIDIHTTFTYDNPNNDWLSVFPMFSSAIQSKLQSPTIVSLTNSSFSTSTNISTSAFQIALMDACKDFFEYAVYYKCNIPQIRLLGSANDWRSIYNNLDKLAEFDLAIWIDALKPIIREFIITTSGPDFIDIDFWKDIFQFNNKCGSGHDYITGWITKFFPYALSFDNSWLPTKLINPSAFDYQLSIDSFGIGTSSVPFNWVFPGKSFKMNFVGGFLATTISPQNFAKPIIGCAVAESSNA